MKLFPIHSGARRVNPFLPPSVPWALVENHDAQARINHSGQSLEQLAELGGLTPLELWAVCHDQRYPCTQQRAAQWLAGRVPTIESLSQQLQEAQNSEHKWLIAAQSNGERAYQLNAENKALREQLEAVRQMLESTESYAWEETIAEALRLATPTGEQ